MREFGDRVAVITGAGSGIGRALARALAAEGAYLALFDIDARCLDETRALVEPTGTKVSSYPIDVSDRAAMFAAAGSVVDTHGKVNLLVNNAGVTLGVDIANMTEADLRWLMDIDFWGVVHGTQAFLPHLIASGEGHVVNLSSVFGLIAVPGQGAYHAAKFAVRGFTECLRQELEVAGAPVSATCVHPGGVRTNIARNARIPAREDARSAEELDALFARIARTTPERAAELILRGVRKNKRRVLIGPEAYIIDWVQRLFPSGYQRLLVWAAKRSGANPIV